MMRSLMMLVLCLTAGGCAGGGFLGNAVGGGTKKVEVKARYHGLEGKRIAVLVAANDYLLYQHPTAAQSVCVAVTNRLAANLPTVTVMPPQQVRDFQATNPFWTTMSYTDLMEKLAVDRVVMIDLSEYRTNEPGNAHVWQGFISAEVGVIESENTANETMVFREPITARYPERIEIGVLESDQQTIELGMLAFFSRDAAGLFYDHTIEVKK